MFAKFIRYSSHPAIFEDQCPQPCEIKQDCYQPCNIEKFLKSLPCSISNICELKRITEKSERLLSEHTAEPSKPPKDITYSGPLIGDLCIDLVQHEAFVEVSF